MNKLFTIDEEVICLQVERASAEPFSSIASLHYTD